MKTETLSERIVKEAREWLSTRWSHQQRIKGKATDCAGFILGVAAHAKTGVSAGNEQVEELARELQIPDNYHRRENGELLLKLLNEHMINIPLEEVSPGDVLALIDGSLREPEIPRHLAIVTEVSPNMKIIHAGEHGVVEHRMNGHWMRRRHSVWRIPE